MNFFRPSDGQQSTLERKDGFKWVAPRIQASVTYYLNKYPKE